MVWSTPSGTIGDSAAALTETPGPTDDCWKTAAELAPQRVGAAACPGVNTPLLPTGSPRSGPRSFPAFASMAMTAQP